MSLAVCYMYKLALVQTSPLLYHVWPSMQQIPLKIIYTSPNMSCPVMVWLACMPENHRGMHGYSMMGSGRLPEGGLEGVSPRMEAGEPLEGRLISSDEVSMSHGCSRQDSDYLACWPILAWSMQCKDESSAQEAAQWSLDASVSLMIVHD